MDVKLFGIIQFRYKELLFRYVLILYLYLSFKMICVTNIYSIKENMLYLNQNKKGSFFKIAILLASISHMKSWLNL